MSDSLTRVPVTIGRFLIPAIEFCNELSKCNQSPEACLAASQCLGRANTFATSDAVFDEARLLWEDNGLNVSDMLWRSIHHQRQCDDASCATCTPLKALAAEPAQPAMAELLTPVFDATYIVDPEQDGLWGTTEERQIRPTSFIVRNAWFDTPTEEPVLRRWSMPSMRIEVSFELNVLETAAAEWRDGEGRYQTERLIAWEAEHIDYRISDDVDVTMSEDHLKGKPPMLFTQFSLLSDIWF